MLLVAFCVAAAPWLARGYVQECWSMGETCGDESRCTGMGTHCGDRSECSGSSTTCGAASICSGMDSRCGPGSQCTGLGAECEGGSAPAQQQDDDSTAQPATVLVYGCDQGDVCSGRSGAAQSNGVTVCCKAGCGDCSASTSQSGDVLTATCVCNDPQTTKKPEVPASAGVCETGDACMGRPGAASAMGEAFCCPASCAQCTVSGRMIGGSLKAQCQCGGQQLAEEPEVLEAQFTRAQVLAFLGGASFVLAGVAAVRRSGRAREVWQEPLLA